MSCFSTYLWFAQSFLKLVTHYCLISIAKTFSKILLQSKKKKKKFMKILT